MSNTKKNLFYQISYQILILILPFITSPYVSRVLGPEKIGIHSYTHSIASYFVLFAMLGINNYGNRQIAINRDDRNKLDHTFSNIFYLHSLISIITIIGYLFYSGFLVKENKMFALIQSLYVFGSLFDINWFFFGMEKFKITVTRNTIIKILTIICIFIFVRSSNDLWKYTTIMALGSLISQSMIWITLHKFVSFKKPQWKEVFSHFIPMSIYFIPVIAISLYKMMSKIMIGILSTKTQVGFYENADKIISIPIALITGIGTVMMPKMSNLISKGHIEKNKEYISIFMQIVLFITFAVSFGLAAVSKEFSILFWGKRFEPCALLISGLAVSIPFIGFANVIRTQYLIPYNFTKSYTASVFSGAFVAVVLNFLLIPHLHAFGAVIGTVAAEITVCVIQMLAVRKELPIGKYILSAFPFIIIGSIMYACVFLFNVYFKTSILNFCLKIVIGGLVYLSLNIIYFIATKNQLFIRIIKNIKLFPNKKTT